MKDYSKNHDDAKRYILSYKVDGENIIVNMATGKTYTIANDKKLEKMIISKMEDQAKSASVKPVKKIHKILAISQPLVLPFAIINYINSGSIFLLIIAIIIAEGAIEYPLRVIINKIKNHDVKKLEYFLDHQRELNESIKKNDFVKIGVSKKAMDQMEIEKKNKNNPVNINNIDSFSLSDLKTLKSNIEIVNAFYYGNLAKPNENHNKTLIKK